MRVARTGNLLFAAAIALLLSVAAAVVAHNVDGLPTWVGVVPALLVLVVAARRPIRRWRAVREPFPEEWQAWLRKHAPVYREASPPDRQRFERDVLITLSEARFEALEAVELTDDLRLTVAAGVATLLHGRPDWELDLSRTFLFYPDTFDDDYLVEGESDYDGMVHPQGPVLLSQRAAVDGWARPEDGSNVVLHELAHLFDFADPADADADGIPTLLDSGSQHAWQQLARREMALARRGRSVLGRYAATHPAEFFAVGTERFFEMPDRMAERHPELFDAFRALYNLDPRSAPQDAPAQPAARSVIARRLKR